MAQIWTDYWSAIMVGVVILAVVATGLSTKGEIDRNDRVAPPNDVQVRWHVRHMRHDVALISYMLVVIAFLLAAILAQLVQR